jgi:predicted AlkP superfamily pyrophosphatase or phosphodiesterase
MKRICILNIAGLSPRVLAGATDDPFGDFAVGPLAMEPTTPVLRASVQASMTTGVSPGKHGVLGGGIFRRQARSVGLDERSNTLLAEKRFWHARALDPRPSTALIFWTHPLAGAADVVLGATTYGCRCGRIASQPVGMYEEIIDAVGELDLSTLQGSGASHRSAEWIAEAAGEVWDRRTPDLMCVHLPGVDFEIIRHGVDSDEAQLALSQVARSARALIGRVKNAGGEVLLTSDGGYVDVSAVARPNLRLKEAGLHETKRTECGEVIDLENSRAFALADHQLAHLYCDRKDIDLAAAAVASDDAVDQLVNRDELFEPGLGHDRAGERIALARPDAWMSYRWWGEDEEIPACAEYSDCGHKGGFDPCEFLPGPQGKGMDLDESHVKASRGLAGEDHGNWCVLASSSEVDHETPPGVTDVPALARAMMGL